MEPQKPHFCHVLTTHRENCFISELCVTSKFINKTSFVILSRALGFRLTGKLGIYYLYLLGCQPSIVLRHH